MDRTPAFVITHSTGTYLIINASRQSDYVKADHNLKVLHYSRTQFTHRVVVSNCSRTAAMAHPWARCCSRIALISHSGGARFESRPGFRLHCLTVVVIFFSPQPSMLQLINCSYYGLNSNSNEICTVTNCCTRISPRSSIRSTSLYLRNPHSPQVTSL